MCCFELLCLSSISDSLKAEPLGGLSQQGTTVRENTNLRARQFNPLESFLKQTNGNKQTSEKKGTWDL